jgi:hypothetical protein
MSLANLAQRDYARHSARHARRPELHLNPRLFLVAAFFVISQGFADARDLDPELRQFVIASCSQDAFRLCPQALNSEHEAVSCMRGKRSQLNQICRTAYDKAARVLAR